MALMLYRVLDASGGFVNGVEVAIGTDVAMTPEEARYEVDIGNVRPLGLPAPTPAVPVLLASDFVTTRRGVLDRGISLAAFEDYLARGTGALADFIEGQDDALAVRLTRLITERLAALGVGDIVGLDAALAAKAAKAAQDNLAASALTKATLLGALTPEIVDAMMTAFRAVLPALPDTDAQIPAKGGWYVRGSSLVFIDPV